jgi:hypothetical protein
MKTIEVARAGALLAALAAHGRGSEIPEAVDAYGWLIGIWELETRRTLLRTQMRVVS